MGEEPLQLPARGERTQPFRLPALASNELMRGEVVIIDVDAEGHVTSDKLEFVGAGKLRLSQLPPPWF